LTKSQIKSLSNNDIGVEGGKKVVAALAERGGLEKLE